MNQLLKKDNIAILKQDGEELDIDELTKVLSGLSSL